MGRIVLDVIPTESRNKYKAGKIPVIYLIVTKATDHDILAEEDQHNKNNNEDLQDIARENSLMN